MKSFRFRLQRLLDLRRTLFEIEDQKRRVVAAQLEQIEQRLLTHDEKMQAAEEVLRAGQIEAFELQSLAAFREASKAPGARLAKAKAEAETRLNAQMERSVAAQQGVRMLERLKEKRVGEWQQNVNREIEETAAESHLVRFLSGS